MKTNIHFWSYLAHFFLEWDFFSDKRCRENQNTRFMFNNVISKIVSFMRYVGKYGRTGQATDDNMAHEHFMLDD